MSANNLYLESEKPMCGVNLTRRFRSRLLYLALTKLMYLCLPSPTKFLNYGYAPLLNDPAFTAPISPPDEEPDLLFIQLYHRIVHAHLRASRRGSS